MENATVKQYALIVITLLFTILLCSPLSATTLVAPLYHNDQMIDLRIHGAGSYNCQYGCSLLKNDVVVHSWPAQGESTAYLYWSDVAGAMATWSTEANTSSGGTQTFAGFTNTSSVANGTLNNDAAMLAKLGRSAVYWNSRIIEVDQVTVNGGLVTHDATINLKNDGSYLTIKDDIEAISKTTINNISTGNTSFTLSGINKSSMTRVHLDFNGKMKVTISNSSNIKFYGLVFTPGPLTDYTDFLNNALIDVRADSQLIDFEDCTIPYLKVLGSRVNVEGVVSAKANYIQMYGSNNTVSGVNITGQVFVDGSHNQVNGNTITMGETNINGYTLDRGEAIKINGDNITADNNTIYSAYPSNQEDGILVGGSDNVITNNNIGVAVADGDGYRSGIVLSGATLAYVEKNHVFDMSYAGIRLTNFTTSSQILENTIHNVVHGVEIQRSSGNLVAQSNVIINASNYGIYIYSLSDDHADNNIIKGNRLIKAVYGVKIGCVSGTCSISQPTQVGNSITKNTINNTGLTTPLKTCDLITFDAGTSQTVINGNRIFSGCTKKNSYKSKENKLGDPISAATRSYFFQVPMFNLGGPLPVRYGLSYQSFSDFQPGFLAAVPHIWRTDISSTFILGWGDGRDELYFEDPLPLDGTWENPDNSTYQYDLQEETGANGWFYLMDPSDQSVYIFEKNDQLDDSCDQEAHLRYRMDRNGNQLSYSYTCWNCYPNTTTVSDGLGRQLSWTEDSNQHLSSVSDGSRSYTMTYNGSGQLTGITNPLVDTTTYQYTDTLGHTISSQLLPQSNTPYSQTYEATYDGRVTSQTDAYSNTTTLSELFDSNPTTPDPVTETNPDGSEVVYTHALDGNSPLSTEDAEGNTATFTVNNSDQTTAITDRMGDSTSMTYHDETGFISSFTNAQGDTVQYTYTAQAQTFTNPANSNTFSFTFYNRTRIDYPDYPDATYETFVYDGKGNLLSSTDRNQKTHTYTYNSKGQLLTVENPIGGVATFTYNADGTRASSTNSDTGVTTYGYDSLKRLTSTNPPGTGQFDVSYDLMDRVTSITDENSHSYIYQYDKNGNLIKTTDPSSNFTQYSYDLMDRLTQVTNRNSHAHTINYNNRGQVSAITTPTGIQTAYSYNNRNWLVGVSTNSKTQTISRDNEGVQAATTTAAGNTTQQQTDKLGHVTSVTLPGGQTSNFVRNSMSQITSATDPLSRKTQYSYDNNGYPKQIIIPDGGTTVYTRDDMGNLSNINDLNNNNWGFGYSTMGRLLSVTDPLSGSSVYELDDKGRIQSIIFPDSSTVTKSYDDKGNLKRLLYSDATDLVYTYDTLDNLLTTNDLTLTRDKEERILSSTSNSHTFGVTYDNDGRIATATYGGALTVTYGYNADNRLSRVSDTLWNQIDFAYSNDGLLTNTTRSNGINGSYTWNTNGQLTHIQEGAFMDLNFAYDGAAQITSTTGTWPLEQDGLLSASLKNFTVNAASRVNSSGYGYDLLGRAIILPGHALSWDGADRLTAIDGARFTYNGLNEITSRSENGNTLYYYHNHALSMVPVVAEQMAGNFTRYYIYTPSGELLYSIEPQNSNAVAFYHHDQVGTTLALTDNNGDVTDRYAYTPFGEILGHSGSSNQPYTFVGTLGVRQEGDLYQMRQRYYDPVNARFLSMEPLWPQIDSPDSLMPYQYASNNPVLWNDPSGLESSKSTSVTDTVSYGHKAMDVGKTVGKKFMQARDLINKVKMAKNAKDATKNMLRLAKIYNNIREGLSSLQLAELAKKFKGLGKLGKTFYISGIVIDYTSAGIRIYEMADPSRNSKAVGEENNAKWYWDPSTWVGNKLGHLYGDWRYGDEDKRFRNTGRETGDKRIPK